MGNNRRDAGRPAPASAAAALQAATGKKAQGDLVVAMRDGFYNGTRKRKGTTFRLNKPSDFSDASRNGWMKRADAGAAPAVEESEAAVQADGAGDDDVI